MQPIKIAHIADEVDLKSKATSGTIQLFEEELLLSLETAVTIPFNRIEDVAIRRINGVGTVIRITEIEGLHHLVVPHLNIGGQPLIIYTRATIQRFERIRPAWRAAGR